MKKNIYIYTVVLLLMGAVGLFQQSFTAKPEAEEKEEFEEGIAINPDIYMKLEPMSPQDSRRKSQLIAQGYENIKPYFGSRQVGAQREYKGAYKIANDTDQPLYIGFYLYQDPQVSCFTPEAEGESQERLGKLALENPSSLYLAKDAIITLPPKKIVRFRLPYADARVGWYYTTIVCTTNKAHLMVKYSGVQQFANKNKKDTVELGGYDSWKTRYTEPSEHIVIIPAENNDIKALSGEEAKNKIHEMTLMLPPVPTDTQEYNRKVQDGFRNLKTIMHPQDAGDLVEKSKKNMAAIMYFLHAKAREKGQQFEEGSFILEDPDGKLSTWIQSLDGCNPRISSHMKEYNTQNYGIDVKGLLPWNDLNTVLVIPFKHANTGKTCLFLKPEKAGTETAWDNVLHTIHFIEAQARKLQTGGDDRPEWRKERVPDEIVTVFLEIIRKDRGQDMAFIQNNLQYMLYDMINKAETTAVKPVRMTIEALKSLKKRALASYNYLTNTPQVEPDNDISEGLTWGIWRMIKIIKALPNAHAATDEIIKFYEIADGYSQKIEIQNMKKDQALRKGREVILRTEELEAAVQIPLEAEEREEDLKESE